MAGTAVGDGGLQPLPKKTRYARVRIRHGEAQKDLVLLKYEVLKDWCGSPPLESQNGGWGRPTWSFSTRGRPEIHELWTWLYSPTGRRIPVAYLEKYFSDEMLAWWIMDDGSMSGRMLAIHTNRYPVADIEAVAAWFREVKGWKAACRVNKGRPFLLFDVISSGDIGRRVLPFMLPSLQYKVLDAAVETPVFCKKCGTEIPRSPGSYVAYRHRKFCAVCLPVHKLEKQTQATAERRAARSAASPSSQTSLL